jgi:hypothetical protein
LLHPTVLLQKPCRFELNGIIVWARESVLTLLPIIPARAFAERKVDTIDASPTIRARIRFAVVCVMTDLFAERGKQCIEKVV